MRISTMARSSTGLLALMAGLVMCSPSPALAHCDSLDGPVVKAARKALADKNVSLVLIWVQADDEPELRAAFAQTLDVRSLNANARALADRYFFETVVRLHRSGEGAPYTGLKAAGRDLGPAIPAADKALATGSLTPVIALLAAAMEGGLRTHFAHAVETQTFDARNVAAGREHVRAYVEFIHYVERLFEAITASAHGHFTDPHLKGR